MVNHGGQKIPALLLRFILKWGFIAMVEWDAHVRWQRESSIESHAFLENKIIESVTLQLEIRVAVGKMGEINDAVVADECFVEVGL